MMIIRYVRILVDGRAWMICDVMDVCFVYVRGAWWMSMDSFVVSFG